MRRVGLILATLCLTSIASAEEPQVRGGVGIAVSQNNSRYAPLGANARFTGATDDLHHYQEIDIDLAGTPANAPGTLFFEFSPDGTSWDVSIPLPVSGPNLIPVPLRVVLPFFRVRYVNGATPQTRLALTVVYHNSASSRLTRFPFQTIDPNEPVEVTHALVAGQRPDGTYANVVLDTANRIATSFSGNVSVIQSTNPWLTEIQGHIGAPFAFQQAVTITAGSLPSNVGAHVFCVKNMSPSTVPVYIGPAGVTTTTGDELIPGDPPKCYYTDNTNRFYVIAAAPGATISASGN